MSALPITHRSQALTADLIAALGESAVDTRTDELDFFARDVFTEGTAPLAIVRPTSTAQVADAVRIATSLGVAVIARGGGLSYTDGYLATQPAVLLDTSALNHVLSVNPTDMTVTVQCGAYWADVDAALAPHGLRTPYWGPLSGLRSAVGGALSQGSIFLGSGLHGSVGDSVIGLRVVTADGSIVTTGSGAAGGNTQAFMRYFGPDLTGLFVGDAGSLGVKVEATLRLIPRPVALDFCSFEFPEAQSLLQALAQVSREGLASECFGFDPTLAKVRLKRASLFADAKTLLSVVKQSGIKAGLGLVTAGRNFLEEGAFSGHAIIEGRSTTEVGERLVRVRAIMSRAGKETDNSIPKAMRATPFVPPNSIVGPAGERWVPVHGIVPHSEVPRALAAVDAYFAAHAKAIEAHAIQIGALYCTISHQATLIEPVFFWPDSHTAYHKRVVDPSYLNKVGEPQENPAARALVTQLKRGVADVLRGVGATHFQLGKFYDYRSGRDAAALALFDGIKRQLDPRGLMNPGVLR